MKHAKKRLACLLAGLLTLAVFAGCSALPNFATVQRSPEEARALMQQIDPDLQYDETLEATAARLAEWLAEDPAKLSTAESQLVRKVPLSADSGNMVPGISVGEFITCSSDWMLIFPSDVKVGLTLNNEGNPYYDPGRLYVPAADTAAQLLRSEAEGCSRMGAVFLQYDGGLYAVALFR